MHFQVLNENFGSIHANCSHFVEESWKKGIGRLEKDRVKAAGSAQAEELAMEAWE